MTERKIKNLVLKGLENSRIVIINGARQCGKTTLAKQIAEEKNINYITFDDPQKLDLAKNDPKAFINFYNSPIIIDEVQYAPEIIPYIKQKVDTENRKGMYLLTGSSDFYKNIKITESLAGRMIHFELQNLSSAEINNYPENILDLLFDNNIELLVKFNQKYNKTFADVIKRILNGSFPEIQNLDSEIRKIWFQSYIQSRILKDIDTFFDIKKENKILDLITILAGNNSNLLNINNIAGKLQIDFKTVQKYIYLLEAMYLIKQLPVYSQNISKQVIKQKKLHFTDSGLVSSILNLTENKILTREENVLGSILENYIFNEISKANSYSGNKAIIYHFRDLRMSEVDFIIENNENKTIAVEIKSKATIQSNDVKNIINFAKNFKGKLFRAYVIYSGDEIIPVANKENIKIYLIPSKIFA